VTLDRELAQLLDVERFEPPPDFRERALLSDPAVYEEAASDPQAWWARQAERLHWFRRWDEVLDDSNPPFYKWFLGGTLNVSYNCLDRHVEAGRGDGVAFARPQRIIWADDLPKTRSGKTCGGCCGTSPRGARSAT
jgi:acetyl-CoA synthetase